jgi:hypothetical protein
MAAASAVRRDVFVVISPASSRSASPAEDVTAFEMAAAA